MAPQKIQIIVRPQTAVDDGPPVLLDLSGLLRVDDRIRKMVADDDDAWMVAESAIEALLARGVDPFGRPVEHLVAEWLDDVDNPDERELWLDQNPLWDGADDTPHPFGGYTSTRQEVCDGEEHTLYLDAQGRRHRTDGPAVVTVSGAETTHRWYAHGKNTREGAPSTVVTHDGTVVGFAFTDGSGRLHNPHGPALMDEDSLSWYLRGELTAHCTLPTDATGQRIPFGSAAAPVDWMQDWA